MTLFFADSPLDHAGLMRADPDWIEDRRREPGAKAVFFIGGDLALDEHGAPLILPARRTGMLPVQAPGLVFIGLEDGQAWFAATLADGAAPRGPDFRAWAMGSQPGLAAILGRARSLLLWHGRRRFCSSCGARNEAVDGGAKLVCASCGTEHFPRVDPSVIMLAHAGERCVLGRQPAWPPGMFSTLAGFMEPGETIEEACAREVKEEVGLTVLSVRYVASQPWPFPSSLMIGLIAEVEAGELRPDDDIEEARWFSRAEATALMEGHWARRAPPGFSIARMLIGRWISGAL